jgi:hypothetical protein
LALHLNGNAYLLLKNGVEIVKDNQLLNNEKLGVSETPPYDPLHAFVRENHIALKG